ncbi:MAG: TonB-dependent receptor [Acidobacteria bacterium]|nr:TonB-dependent receptor [Acidobacteriota bacterium]
MGWKLGVGILMIACWQVLGSLALAQSSTAIISGVVADGSGAIIPSVQVAARNVETGRQRTGVADAAGRYSIPELTPGPYEITVSHTGFETLVRQGITLTVGQEARINLTMRLGAISQQVTITEQAPLVDTSSSGVSGVVEEKRITELPLNGRDFSQLALVQPGVLSVRNANSGATRGFGAVLALAGSRPSETGWTLDGTNVTSVGTFSTPGSAGGGVLGVDAVREFRVITGGGYSAEYGGYSGGIVQMVTKSGTNQFHGTAFALHRNDNLDATTWEANRAGKGKPEFRRNQFGGSLGGPVMRDKFFFLGAYEGLRQARVGDNLIERVPDLNVRRGILPNGTQVAVSPSIRPYLDLWPLPNEPAAGDGTAIRNTPSNAVTNEDYYVTRSDYTINDNRSLFFRYTHDDADQSIPRQLGVYNTLIVSRTRYATAQFNNTLSPALLSTSSMSFNRSNISPDVFLNIDYPANLYFMHHGYPPTFVYAGVDPFGVVDAPRLSVLNKWEMSQSMFYTKGAHSLKFGGLYQHTGFNTNGPSAGVYGSFDWNSAASFLADNTMQTLQVEVPGAATARTIRGDFFGFYLQDSWQVRPTFTLNLGLRYEPWTSPTEKWDRVATYRDWVTATQFSHSSTDGTTTYLNSPGEKSFSPRVGFAWDLNGDGKTAIRGGAGIFHMIVTPPYLSTIARKNPPDAGTLIASDATNLAGAASYALAATPRIRSITLSPSTFSEFITYDLDPMYELKFNLTVEREVIPNLSVALGYVGNRATHILTKSDCNAAPSIQVNGRAFVAARTPRVNQNNGVITCSTSDGKSFYNAMTVEVKRRLSRGLQFQTAYTWAKTVDDSTTGGGNADYFEGILTQPYDHKADRGLAAIHLGHNLVMNGLWALPSPQGEGLPVKLLGGWHLTSIFSATSGVPARVKLRGRSAPDLSRSANNQTPELGPGRTSKDIWTGVTAGCPGVAAGQRLGTPDLYYDPCAYTIPPAAPAGLAGGGFYGNAGRNTILGPAYFNLDFSLKKSTPIGLGESGQLLFHLDSFNLMNHPNFGAPQDQVRANTGALVAGAGKISSTSHSERQLQLGLKLIF